MSDTQMTETEQIIAIAELDGWKFDGEKFYIDADPHHVSIECFDYLTSYDAIIPVIAKQDVRIQIELAKHLQLGFFDELRWSCVAQAITQQPAKLSEALLRAAGKWK